MTFLARAANFPASPFGIMYDNHFRTQQETHPVVLQFHELIQLLIHLGIGSGGGHQPGDDGGVEEGLFVAEHHGLTADGLDPFLHRQLDGADGRGRGGGKFFFGLIGHVRTCIQLGLTAGQGHGKGQTGGQAAFLTVGLGEHFKDFNSS